MVLIPFPKSYVVVNPYLHVDYVYADKLPKYTHFNLGGGDDFGYGSSRNDHFDGGWDKDEIWGYDGQDTLLGNYGNDTLWGGDKGDFLDGGRDNDTLYGEDGEDTLLGGTEKDTLYGDFKDRKADGGDKDILFGGDGNDILYGCGGDDILSGDKDNDSLNGDGGNDKLGGGAGTDSLTGGTGSDIFFFDDNYDIEKLFDFNRGEGDKIDVRYLDLVKGMVDTTLPQVEGSFWGLTSLYINVFNELMEHASNTKVGYKDAVKFDFGADELIIHGQTVQTIQISDFLLW